MSKQDDSLERLLLEAGRYFEEDLKSEYHGFKFGESSAPNPVVISDNRAIFARVKDPWSARVRNALTELLPGRLAIDSDPRKLGEHYGEIAVESLAAVLRSRNDFLPPGVECDETVSQTIREVQGILDSLPSYANATSRRKQIIEPLLKTKTWTIQDWAEKAVVDWHTANDYYEGRTQPRKYNRKKLANALGLPDLP